MTSIDKPVAIPPSSLVRRLGPGLITGAADDDPSGIATYSQVGAQFGYGLAWTMLFSLPFMIVIQEVSGRIGCVTGRGIADNLRRHYPSWLVRSVVALLLVANVINLGADLGAMGAALRLLVGGSAHLYTVAFGILCIVAEVFLSYPVYAGFLKWLTLSLFTYVAVVFAVHVPWDQALVGTLVPHLSLDHDEAMALVAVLGTTISPYLFFWQSSLEVEDGFAPRRSPAPPDPWPRGTAVPADPSRHGGRHGSLEPDRTLHHLRDCRDAASLRASSISRPRRRPRKRSGPSPAMRPSSSSRPASSARGCSPCRCWPARGLSPFRTP